jgi:hypothetical protein
MVSALQANGSKIPKGEKLKGVLYPGSPPPPLPHQPPEAVAMNIPFSGRYEYKSDHFEVIEFQRV